MSAAAPSLSIEIPTPRTRAEINRANSQHSTGPRTPEGKSRASQNALKHGLFADTVVLPGEDRDAFDSLAHAYANDLNAQTEEELALVQDIVNSRWRLHRICARENALTILTTEQQRASVEKMFDAPTLAQTFDDPETALTALAQAAGFQANARLFNQLSLFETRLHRRAELAEKKLQFLVNTRHMRSLPEPGLELLDVNSQAETHTPPARPDIASGFVPPLSQSTAYPPNMPHFSGPAKKENRRQWLRKHGFTAGPATSVAAKL